jgi:hypothetical protein
MDSIQGFYLSISAQKVNLQDIYSTRENKGRSRKDNPETLPTIQKNIINSILSASREIIKCKQLGSIYFVLYVSNK